MSILTPPVTLLADEELLRFPPDSAWRRALQPAAARRHPGKLDLFFLAWLAQRYIAPGAAVVDPLAGSGSILLLTLPPWGAAVTCNELEPAWAAAAEATWAHLQGSLVAPTGTARILCGDAGTLPARLAGPCDALICSPPYADALGAQERDFRPERMAGHPIGKNGPARLAAMSTGYQVDALITSPPYADALGPGHVGPALDRLLAGRADGGSKTAANGHNYGNGSSLLRAEPTYDALVTSPPYSDALSHQRHAMTDQAREARYDTRGGAASRTALREGYDGPTPGQRNPAQIGNLSGARYTAAMQAVWAACVPLVRPGGHVVVVLKNIVRRNAEVDLIGQTAAQLAVLGLVPVATHYRAVRTGPFHHIRRKAHPDALIIDREGALVFEVPA